MATIGHTLVGLAMSSASTQRSRGGKLAYAWPGVVVLMAHLPDVVEWLAAFVAPRRFSRHFLTVSPVLGVTLGLLMCGIIFALTRIRKPLAYIIIVAAVLSHLIMDQASVREAIADAFGNYSVNQELPGLRQSIMAELWFYGLILVEALLLRSAFEPGCSAKGRALSFILGLGAILGALSHRPFIFFTVYFLCLLHAALLLRKEFSFKYAWSLLPLIPVAALVGTEVAAIYYRSQAEMSVDAHDYLGAIGLYQKAIEMPTRSTPIVPYVELSKCYEAIGWLDQAETALLTAEKMPEAGFSPSYYLAWFYIDESHRGTKFFQPEEAARRFRKIKSGPYIDKIIKFANGALVEMKQRGLISE